MSRSEPSSATPEPPRPEASMPETSLPETRPHDGPPPAPGPMARLGALLRGRFGGLVAIALLLVVLLPSMSLWRRVQSLEVELAAARGAAEPPAGPTAPQPYVPSLQPLTTGGDAPVLAAGVGHLLEWPAPADGGDADDGLVRLILVDEVDQGRWSADVSGATPRRLTLPPGALTPGLWHLRVEVLSPGAAPRAVAEYPFRIQK